jgi:hypothetical protein
MGVAARRARPSHPDMRACSRRWARQWVWGVAYLVVDVEALRDAQVGLLFLPAVPSGALACDALAVALRTDPNERRSGSAAVTLTMRCGEYYRRGALFPPFLDSRR